MNNKNILEMEKMGMNIYKDSDLKDITNLSNFRYYLHNIELKNGKICKVIEISRGARYTKKSLMKHKSADMFGTWFHTYYYDENGVCRGLLDIDKELNKGNYENKNLYTKETILKLINSISVIKYDEIKEV